MGRRDVHSAESLSVQGSGGSSRQCCSTCRADGRSVFLFCACYESVLARKGKNRARLFGCHSRLWASWIISCRHGKDGRCGKSYRDRCTKGKVGSCKEIWSRLCHRHREIQDAQREN